MNFSWSTNSTNVHLAKLNPFRYRGYYYDSETGFYYLNARYYSPEWRRFISPANVSAFNPQSVNGLNLYVYAKNNPISYAFVTFAKEIAIGCNAMCLHSQVFSDNSNDVLIKIPTWMGPISTGIDHVLSLINPIRSAIAVFNYDDLWELMRLDGVTELPGALSKVATGVSYTLGVVDGILGGYEKYSTGASFSSSTMSALVYIRYNIGITAASSASVAAVVSALAASTAIPGGVLIVGGAVLAIGLSALFDYLLTEFDKFGKTYQQAELDFYDWLIWWD